MVWHGEGGEGRGTWVGGRRGILERRPWSPSLGSWGGRKGGSLVYHPPPSPDMQPHLPRDVDVQGADWPTIGEMFYFQDWTSPAGSDAMTIGRRRPGGDDGEGGGERGGHHRVDVTRDAEEEGEDWREPARPIHPLAHLQGTGSHPSSAIRNTEVCKKKMPSGCRPSVSQSSGTEPLRGGDSFPPPHRMAWRGGGSGRVGEEVLEAP